MNQPFRSYFDAKTGQRVELVMVICGECAGTGRVVKTELIDAHKGDYEKLSVTCENCEGHGRVVRETKTRTFTINSLPSDSQ